MTTHSSILAWRIPWKKEPGGLESMGSQRVRYNRVTNTHTHTHTHTISNVPYYLFLNVQFDSIKFIHIVMKQISRNFSSCKAETLYPFIKLSTPRTPTPTSDNHFSTFCFYEFG